MQVGNFNHWSLFWDSKIYDFMSGPARTSPRVSRQPSGQEQALQLQLGRKHVNIVCNEGVVGSQAQKCQHFAGALAVNAFRVLLLAGLCAMGTNHKAESRTWLRVCWA